MQIGTTQTHFLLLKCVFQSSTKIIGFLMLNIILVIILIIFISIKQQKSDKYRKVSKLVLPQQEAGHPESAVGGNKDHHREDLL